MRVQSALFGKHTHGPSWPIMAHHGPRPIGLRLTPKLLPCHKALKTPGPVRSSAVARPVRWAPWSGVPSPRARFGSAQFRGFPPKQLGTARCLWGSIYRLVPIGAPIVGLFTNGEKETSIHPPMVKGHHPDHP